MSKQSGTNSEECKVAFDTITLCVLMSMTINTILNKYYLIRYTVYQTSNPFLVCSVYISLRNNFLTSFLTCAIWGFCSFFIASYKIFLVNSFIVLMHRAFSISPRIILVSDKL